MSQMAVLDVAIGLTFMYMLISLLVTTVQEWIASWFRLRATNLYDAIANLLADPQLKTDPQYRDLVVDFYRHPLMQSLYRRPEAIAAAASVAEFRAAAKKRLPSYIPSRVFATALLDVLRGKTKASEACGFDALLIGSKSTIDKLPPGELKTALLLLVGEADAATGKLNVPAEQVSKRIERWFNDAMSRAAGWYKRRAQLLSFAIGISSAAALNADTLHVADRLWNDSALRAAVTASATSYYDAAAADGTEGSPTAKPGQQYARHMQQLDTSSLPIGWGAHAPQSLPLALVGWLLTALAASLGAAFWFDVLGKALQIRGSGTKVSATTGNHVDHSDDET